MEYLVGFVLASAVAVFAAFVGFDRDRSFYPTVLIITGSYYALFALMGQASGRTLVEEIAVGSAFLLLAVAGFKRSWWLVAAAFAGHALLDFLHYRLIENPGVPPWWPGFCLTIDVAFAAVCAVRLPQNREIVPPSTTLRGASNAQS